VPCCKLNRVRSGEMSSSLVADKDSKILSVWPQIEMNTRLISSENAKRKGEGEKAKESDGQYPGFKMNALREGEREREREKEKRNQ
jgi:hypothetical protein